MYIDIEMGLSKEFMEDGYLQVIRQGNATISFQMGGRTQTSCKRAEGDIGIMNSVDIRL